jgi:hypothetical protein
MLGGIKWPILYHQALIQKSNAKIKASLSQNVKILLFIRVLAIKMFIALSERA